MELEAAVAAALTRDVDERLPDIRSLIQRLEPAWRSAVGLAEASEVAALVRNAVAPTVARRRAKIERMLAQRVGTNGAVLLSAPADFDEEAVSGDSLVLNPSVSGRVAGGATHDAGAWRGKPTFFIGLSGSESCGCIGNGGAFGHA